ncbi:MAG: type II secretion system secretin GspD [Archangiaceae bacterium]|nr:type II secretion system secretin GspD [Archangiaceae bacterium]
MPFALTMVLLLVTPKESCESLKKNARFTALFERVDLDKLVQTVSDATCKTFLLGDNVKGKVSMIGPENGQVPLDADQLYAAFLAALDANGFAVVPSGRFLRVIEKSRAKGAPIVTAIDEGDKFPARDEMVTRVFKAKHVELEALRAVVMQFLSQGADLVPFAPDTLIVNEVGSNLERLQRLIAAIDVERTPSDELRVVPVRFAEASQLGEEVTRVLASKAPRPGESLSVTADERSNRLVVVASAPLMKRAVELIAQLDVSLPGDGKAHVYKLANAEAKELAANLTEVISATAGARGRPGAPPAAGGGSDPKISANESLNALVIVASSADYRNLVELIAELDVPRRQVFIETVVMEVYVERNTQLGASGHFGAAVDGVNVAVGSEPAGAASSLGLKGLAAASGLLFGLQGPEVKALSQALGFTVGQYGLALTANHSTSDTNVMSTPHILTTDNKEAEISVGQRIPFQMGLSSAAASQLAAAGGSSATTLAALTGSVSREKVELKLTVKPHISSGEHIRLDVNQSAEEVSGKNDLGPITSTRAQKTTIVADDGETVVLGGIMQDRVIENVSKTPVLGDLPIIGRLFRYEEKKKVKVNLLVFLTPHVIHRPSDLQRLLRLKTEERRKLLQQTYGADDERSPLDLSRRPGPLMAMIRALAREDQKPENGGPGEPGEIVAPRAAKEVER